MKAKLAMYMSLLFILVAVPARADVPGQVNYQGYLTGPDGASVHGNVEMLFAIYDAATGGAEVWSEGPQDVFVDYGVYNVLLGLTTPITPAMLAGPRWLEVIVEGEYLSPREKIVSALYSIESRNADLLDGVEASELEESAEVDADIAAHTAAADAHHAKTTSFADLTDTAADAQIPDDITVNYAAQAGEAAHATAADDAGTLDGFDSDDFAGAGHDHDGHYYTQAYVDTLEGRISDLETTIGDLQASIGQLHELAQYVTVAGTNITFSGANVHIVNGSGATDGAVDGLGNLIVGYNETRDDGTDDRTGSHNIVTGSRNNYSSYGGLVAGSYNEISGTNASVIGGNHNTASGASASVSGGSTNTADGWFASVSGGFGNTAVGMFANVSGGQDNTAGGDYASLSGGRNNVASGDWSFVGGGGGENISFTNEAFGKYTAILGGASNIAGDPALTDDTLGQQSSVSGGVSNTASGTQSSVSGGSGNTAEGDRSSVTGGYYNEASDYGATVTGGESNTARGLRSSVSGGRNNEASGDYSFVGGGGDEVAIQGNVAYGHYSAILGGERNVAGDVFESSHSIGLKSTVSGGMNNETRGDYSSVSGGKGCEAWGLYSSVSGGASRIAADGYDWRAGSLWDDG